MSGIYAEAAQPTGWRYWPAPAEGIAEIGTLHGSTAGLATHFHDEIQITFVKVGRRRMRIGGHTVEIEAGRCTCIAAGVPHGDLSETTDGAGFIAYVAAGDYDLPALAADVEALWHARGDVPWPTLSDIVARRRGAGRPTAETAAPPSSARMSREGFARLFRRRMGMPPHAFDVAARLNEARRRLREGEPIAEIAAATGFADQSHLGRLFRRAYGVTPGVYGRGHRRVTNVPDR